MKVRAYSVAGRPLVANMCWSHEEGMSLTLGKFFFSSLNKACVIFVCFTHSILFNWNFNLMSRIILNTTIPIEISDDDSDLYLDATPTLSQDCRTLTLDDKNIRIFNVMWGNLPNILMAGHCS